MTTVDGSERSAHSRALLLLIATLLILWTLWSTQVLPLLPEVHGIAHALRSIGVRLLLWVLPCAVYLWWRHGSRALSGLRLGLPPTRIHWFVAFVIVVLASFAVSVDVARKLELSLSEVWLRAIGQMTSAFPTAELFEELIFRSVLLSELLALFGADRTRTSSRATVRQRAWLANVAASLVFVGLHWPWWIFTLGVGERFALNTVGVFLISLVLGILFVGSRSVWPCVLLHVLNNSLSALAG
jgi:membrane protease YdiL (CAAX protease family)